VASAKGSDIGCGSGFQPRDQISRLEADLQHFNFKILKSGKIFANNTTLCVI